MTVLTGFHPLELPIGKWIVEFKGYHPDPYTDRCIMQLYLKGEHGTSMNRLHFPDSTILIESDIDDCEYPWPKGHPLKGKWYVIEIMDSFWDFYCHW